MNTFDSSIIYLMHDQPTTCSICGSRCFALGDFMHTNAKWYIMDCLNEDCRFTFLSAEDEEDLKLPGLK
ncbi:hypothetical protein BH10BAC3_BH10BAC3_41260 [soil metagenome]